MAKRKQDEVTARPRTRSMDGENILLAPQLGKAVQGSKRR